MKTNKFRYPEMTKTDWRILLAKIQKLESNMLTTVKGVERNKRIMTKTRYENCMRNVRLKLQALQVIKREILANLSITQISKYDQPKEFKKNTGFRQTCKIASRLISEAKAKI